MASPVRVQTRLRGDYTPTSCAHCSAQLEFLAPPSTQQLELECAKCHKRWITSQTEPPRTASSSKKASPGTTSSGSSSKRKIGTDDRPLETDYYDLLGLPITCTSEQVKKAYRRLAIKYHPDKNPDDPTAADKFKEIAVAYTTLSDPQLRHKYNEFGKSSKDGGPGGDDAMVDPEAIFSTLFGGERFQDIIGTISLGSEMKSAMQAEESDDDDQDDEAQGTVTTNNGAPPGGGQRPAAADAGRSTKKAKKPLTPEQERKRAQKAELEARLAAEKAAVRTARVHALADKLRDKLALYSEQANGEDDAQIAEGVRTMWRIEADELRNESYGVELLHAVGTVYTMKVRAGLAPLLTAPLSISLTCSLHLDLVIIQSKYVWRFFRKKKRLRSPCFRKLTSRPPPLLLPFPSPTFPQPSRAGTTSPRPVRSRSASAAGSTPRGRRPTS